MIAAVEREKFEREVGAVVWLESPPRLNWDALSATIVRVTRAGLQSRHEVTKYASLEQCTHGEGVEEDARACCAKRVIPANKVNFISSSYNCARYCREITLGFAPLYTCIGKTATGLADREATEEIDGQAGREWCQRARICPSRMT